MELDLSNRENENILNYFFDNPDIDYIEINNLRYFTIDTICKLLKISQEEFSTIEDEVNSEFQILHIHIPELTTRTKYEVIDLDVVDEAGYYFIITKFPNIEEAKKLIEYAEMVRSNIIDHDGVFIHPDILDKFSEENVEISEWLKEHPQDADNLVLPN